jgi:hypothetical protein
MALYRSSLLSTLGEGLELRENNGPLGMVVTIGISRQSTIRSGYSVDGYGV